MKGKFEHYDGTLELAVTHANQHHLGITWNRLGMLRTPSKLILHGRLVQDGN